VVAFGATAYLKMIPAAQRRTATDHLRTIAAAVQMYYQEQRDYPAMRYNDVIPYVNTSGPAPWPDHSNDALPNGVESIEACLYQLEYCSSAGGSLQSLSNKIYRQVSWNKPGVGQTSDVFPDPPGSVAGPLGSTTPRPLHVIFDPWGNPIQYIRPRLPGSSLSAAQAANYPLSPAALNNRVLLVSMGPDGQPGNSSVDAPTFSDDRGDTTQEEFPNPSSLGKGDDIVVEVGRAP
jgi:type II secretory pathway pseudopilin PulG